MFNCLCYIYNLVINNENLWNEDMNFIWPQCTGIPTKCKYGTNKHTVSAINYDYVRDMIVVLI